MLVGRLLALGWNGCAVDGDLDVRLVDAASVAGEGEEGHLGALAGGGHGRVDGRLRADVAAVSSRTGRG